jgi:HSP20 family protein
MMTMLDLVPRYDVSFRPQLSLLDRFFDDTAYHVTMELPGMDMKGLDISYAEGILTVKGEKSKDTSIDESCYCTERYFGSFERSFRIPGKVDADHIEANYKDGILRISLTKSEESAVRKIEVH